MIALEKQRCMSIMETFISYFVKYKCFRVVIEVPIW